MKKNITRKDLVKKINYNIGYSKLISENLVNDIFNLLINNIISNNVLKISNFGNFIKKSKKQRIGRNPKTKEVKIISSRNIIIFRPSKTLKKKIEFNLFISIIISFRILWDIYVP